MKKFTIEISHASGPQLATIALDLKIMSNGWAKHGPRIMIKYPKHTNICAILNLIYLRMN